MSDLDASTLADITRIFRQYKRLAEDAIAQIPDEALLTQLDPESNSIAVIMKHIAGNLRSRFTDFFTSDGEKPDRNRDGEFVVDERTTRAQLMTTWQEAWQILFDALGALSPDDLGRTVTIRAEPHLVMGALLRQLSHHPYHVGQIVYLARHFKGGGFTSLSVPRGQSEQLNARMKETAQAKAQAGRTDDPKRG